jgi:hypothetical protein
VDDDARRLVDHDEVLVLVRSPKLELLSLRRLGRGRLVELDLLPTQQTPRLRAGDSVDEDSRVDRARRGGARADVRRDERVEPRAGRVVRNSNAQTGPLRRA